MLIGGDPLPNLVFGDLIRFSCAACLGALNLGAPVSRGWVGLFEDSDRVALAVQLRQKRWPIAVIGWPDLKTMRGVVWSNLVAQRPRT